MDREAFEQLISEWLDEPQRDDLRVLLEQALADNPAWRDLRREYTQLDRLIKKNDTPDARRGLARAKETDHGGVNPSHAESLRRCRVR